MSVNNIIDFGNTGVVVTGAIAFTSATQYYYNLADSILLMPDGGIVNGIQWSPIPGVAPSYLTIDTGKCVQISLTSTYANLTSVIGSSLLSSPAGITATAPLLTTFTLPKLKYMAFGPFSPTFAIITTLDVPSLAIVATSFAPVLALCTTFTVPSLANVGTSVAMSAASLVTFSLPGLLNVGTTFQITAANMTTFSMNSGLLSIGGNFTMTGMKLNQASVDGILVRLAALDGTGGTTAYSSHTINLSGGTSSAPSATGLAAAVTTN